MTRLPHPIPYQGSKRLLAGEILSVVTGKRFRRLYEPFAGSAAITLAAAHHNIADEYVISDSLAPLVQIWNEILTDPRGLARRYHETWLAQHSEADHYTNVREHYNAHGGSAELLYLLARCVKNAPRFNRDGAFNQSADLRRHGMHPAKMAKQILGAAYLLRARATAVAGDYHDVLAEAESTDLVYMDPPYEGTSTGTDRRYYQQLERERLINTLRELNERDVPFLLSYDGRHGDKTYGEPMPKNLKLKRLEIVAGRSSQATLNGRHVITVESLYVSPALIRRVARGKKVIDLPLFQQQEELTAELA